MLTLRKGNAMAALALGLAVFAFVLLPSTTFAAVPGTNPGPSVNARSGEIAAIVPEVTVTGEITLSVDALGTVASCGLIQVEKPSAGATVHAAYFMAASTGFSNFVVPDGAITLAGGPIPPWLISTPSAIASWNHWTDVTAIVAPIVDPAPAGVLNLQVCELANSPNIDGTILAVIFDDPGAPVKTVSLLFGAQDIAGDTYSLSLAEPLNLADPGVRFDMALGISFGHQDPVTTNQVSLIDVATSPNGPGFQRLTSSAGGEDDGEASNGALITAGGIGDTNGNPPPFAPPADYNVPDDELYDLLPFYTAGDLLVNVTTVNPSNDDNILFAAFCISGEAEVTTGCAVVPPSHDFGMVVVGDMADFSFDIVNTGDTQIDGVVSKDVSADCAHFSIVSGAGAYSLPNNGDMHSVTVRFEPTAMGTYSCSIFTGNQNCPVFTARGQGEQVVPAAIQAYGSRWAGEYVEVAWTLIDMTVPVSADVYRSERLDGFYVPIYDADVNSTGNDFTFRDFSTEPAHEYWYRVVIKENDDPVAQFVTSVTTPSTQFELGQNAPNPFNPSTSIPFTLADNDRVTLTIYDISGRVVSTLIDRPMSAGAHTAHWDGRDNNGNTVASGVYFYRLRSGNHVMTRKAVLMK